MAEKNEKILVDITGLTHYHEKLKDVLKTKADEAAADATSKADAAKAAAEATAAADATSKANAAEQNAKDYADGKFQVAGSYETAGAAAQALADAKADAAEKYQVKGDYETAGAAAAALDSAKSYVDGKVDGKFDAAGAAAAALDSAKSYVDGKVDGKFDAAGAAATVQGNLDLHTGDAVAHITVDERTSWNSAKASIDAFLKDADMTEKAVDTLAELQTYMTTDGAAAAELVGRVAALEEIDHEAYKGADTALETSLKSYVDQAESDALAAAKSYADGKFQVAGNYETAGAAAQALADAKADAASLYQVKIDDLDDIRSGAALGATALQAVPEEYVTETELTGKGYLTANDFGFATDGDIDALFEIQ